MQYRMYRAFAAFCIIATFGIQISYERDRFASDAASNRSLMASTAEADSVSGASVARSFRKLPLAFEINQGQVDDPVKFLARGSGYTFFLTSTEAVLSLRHGSPVDTQQYIPTGFIRGRAKSESTEYDVIRIKSVGSNPNPKIIGLDQLPGKSNYFIGNDPVKWCTDVSNYAKVRIEDLYPGIDLVYYSNQGQLEHDWIVRPGADPSIIKFAVEGESDLRVDAQGNLILDERTGLRLDKPVIYQRHASTRVDIAGNYVLLGGQNVGFRLGIYDASVPLMIDPVLSYSTYLGGSSYDESQAIAVDSSGNAYVAGRSDSANFPTANPLQANKGGPFNVILVKLNASGLVYSTYLGGNSGDDGNGIAVDSFGNAYVTGATGSTDFPTVNPLQAIRRGSQDAFAAKVNASGNALVYSTYLGGSDQDFARGIAVDSSGNAYVTGGTVSTDFPTANAFAANHSGEGEDVFITKLDSSGTVLLYSTYLGGSRAEGGYGIAVDSSGNVYVTGYTGSIDFPTANPFQRNIGSSTNFDAFVLKLHSSGAYLLYSTYLGGSAGDYGRAIAVDASGNAYVTGSTQGGFPLQDPIQKGDVGGVKVFVTKLNISGTALVYSTYLGSGDSVGNAIALDSFGDAYVTGDTNSDHFPTVNPLQAFRRGAFNAFVTKVNASGKALVYSTYLGGSYWDTGHGIAVDSLGNAYVTGTTASTDFPTTKPIQPSHGGGPDDAFVAKIYEPVNISITTSPVGCSFIVDGETYSADRRFEWEPGSSHTIGVTPSQTSGGTRHIFSRWSDAGAITHTLTVSRTDAAYTAEFQTQYQLQVEALPTFGGIINANPTSPDAFYDSGASIQLAATADQDYLFWKWDGDLAGSVNPKSVVMSAPLAVTGRFLPKGTSFLTMSSGGAARHETPGVDQSIRTGYATLGLDAGETPYGTAVFSFRQNGVTVSEAGIPASPPTTQARIFIDLRKSFDIVPGRGDAGKVDVNTGIAVVNTGDAAADVTYRLRNISGQTITTGHGTLAAGKHFACFVDRLKEEAGAPDFSLPTDFPEATQFGSLEITGTQPLSLLALRGTVNQRGDFLLTTTPIADLNKPLLNAPLYFPQFVDGGGYTTSVVLLNTSSATESGKLEILNASGKPISTTPVGGTSGASFAYSIPPRGVFRFQTDGSPQNVKAGWVRLTPDAGTLTPVGSGVFSFNPNDILVSESGIPAAASTTHARVYVDLSNNHNTGLALANLADADAAIEINAFEMDGITHVGVARESIRLGHNGYAAAFADEFIAGLPAEFTGLLDVTSATPFAALTLRSLINERGDFLMAAFPVADANMTAPSPIVFPQVADGGGYTTEFILISPTSGATTILTFYSEDGAPWNIEEQSNSEKAAD